MRTGAGCGRRGHGLALHQPGVLPGALLEPAGQVGPLRAAHHPQLLGHRRARRGDRGTRERRRFPPAPGLPPPARSPPPAGRPRPAGGAQEGPCRGAPGGGDAVPPGFPSLAAPEAGTLPLGRRQGRGRAPRRARGRPEPRRLPPARPRRPRAAPAPLASSRRPHHVLQVTGGSGRGAPASREPQGLSPAAAPPRSPSERRGRAGGAGLGLRLLRTARLLLAGRGDRGVLREGLREEFISS